MNIKEFSDKYRLKIKKDSCDDPIIMGKFIKQTGRDLPEYHHHIYEVDGAFFIYFNFPTVGRWNSVRRKMQELGLHCVRNCTCDGVFLFDPVAHEPAVKIILKLVGVRVKRELTPEQKNEIRARFARK